MCTKKTSERVPISILWGPVSQRFLRGRAGRTATDTIEASGCKSIKEKECFCLYRYLDLTRTGTDTREGGYDTIPPKKVLRNLCENPPPQAKVKKNKRVTIFAPMRYFERY